VFGVQSGEEDQGNNETCKEWKDKLPSPIKGSAPRDIFSMEETWLFSWFQEECKGGKMSK
jgi:hypothetical protein